MYFGIKRFALLGAALVVSACSMLPNGSNLACGSRAPCNQAQMLPSVTQPNTNVSKETEVIDVLPREPIVVRTTGYSAPMANTSFSSAQKRLMAMRGSKLDAYRNLAERVYGIEISSNNLVSNMVTQSDEIRAYVDAYLVGAKVISQREMSDGIFETVVELALKENFRQCVSSVEAMRSNPNCLKNNHYSTRATVPRPEKPSSFYSVK